MALQQGPGAGEDVEDFLLASVHVRRLGKGRRKTKSILPRVLLRLAFLHVSEVLPVPLEDELGDVLEKAMRRRGMSVDTLADASGVAVARICEALDYRSGLTAHELRRLAGALRLNEVGLCALGCGCYPRPELVVLPFRVWPLRMPHGIGVANAYLVSEGGSGGAILFDTGAGIEALLRVWPHGVSSVAAVFLTHLEPEHAGGLCEVMRRFEVPEAWFPVGAEAPCGRAIGDGAVRLFGRISVTAYATPGHAAAHNCYLVSASPGVGGASLLVSGDLMFAGSVGGAYFSQEQLGQSIRRILEVAPAGAVLAPGHGPLSTVANELSFNPFVD
jgi:glyoxylase-like metal-dependent hydrolase (beta-lactamase superfamily II)